MRKISNKFYPLMSDCKDIFVLATLISTSVFGIGKLKKCPCSKYAVGLIIHLLV